MMLEGSWGAGGWGPRGLQRAPPSSGRPMDGGVRRIPAPHPEGVSPVAAPPPPPQQGRLTPGWETAVQGRVAGLGSPPAPGEHPRPQPHLQGLTSTFVSAAWSPRPSSLGALAETVLNKQTKKH